MVSRVIAQRGDTYSGQRERCRRGAVNMALPDVVSRSQRAGDAAITQGRAVLVTVRLWTCGGDEHAPRGRLR